MIECVLFDLDRTLLYMDQDEFTGKYFSCISEYMAAHGYEPSRLIATIYKGTGAMLRNDGSRLGYDAFWTTFAAEYGESALADRRKFDRFYAERFDSLAAFCAPVEGAAKTVAECARLGLKTVLASNPVFPFAAMQKRASWAGLPDVFCRVTSYENSRFCKPNPGYYTEITRELCIAPENCLMVGNDVREDIEAAKKAGLDTFLLPQYVLNPDSRDISAYRRGSMSDLLEYIRAHI